MESKTNPKFFPIDLRPKKTRAIRRRLTPAQVIKLSFAWSFFATNSICAQLAKKTVKQAKKDANFPPRKFAVKAL